jgi:hypothetical protein
VGIYTDKGYIDRLGLGKIAADSVLSRKVTLLTNHSTHPVYRNLPMEFISFEDVFRVAAESCSTTTFPIIHQAYTGTLPAAQSALALSLVSEENAWERVETEAEEISLLKAKLSEAEARVKSMEETYEKENVALQCTHDNARVEAELRSKEEEEGKAKAKVACEERMSTFRQTLLAKQSRKYTIIIECASGVRFSHNLARQHSLAAPEENQC